jgi:hypothetical protein
MSSRRVSPDLTTLTSITDDTIVTRLRERVSVNAPWSKIGNTILVYVNRFNGEQDQFLAAHQTQDADAPSLTDVTARIERYMGLEGNIHQSVILLYFLYYGHVLILFVVVNLEVGKVCRE